jgi:hypothetical protein
VSPAGTMPVAVPLDGSAVAQSFPVPEGGTDVVCVWLETGEATSRAVLLQVHDDQDGRPGVPIARTRLEVRPGAPRCLGTRVAGAFERGATLWVSVRAIPAEQSSGVSLLGSRSDAFRNGRLLVAGEERWGDVAVRASAPGSVRWPNAWPRELPRPASRAGVVLLVGGIVGVATLVLAVAARLAGSSLSAGMTVVLAGTAILSLQALSAWTPRTAPAWSWRGEGRALLDDLHDARMRTSWPMLGAGFDVTTSDISAPADRVLLALPTSSVAWSLQLTEPTSLDTAVALRQEAWTRPGDGATFEISVVAGGRREVLWQGHVDPFSDPGARRWHDVTVRLDRYVGQELTLVLATGPGSSGNAVMDAAMWREPVLRRSR